MPCTVCIQGEPLAHILLQTLVHLSASLSACHTLVRIDTMELVLAMLPLQAPVTQHWALQLLDHLTTQSPHDATFRLSTRHATTALLNLAMITDAVATHPAGSKTSRTSALVLEPLLKLLDKMAHGLAMHPHPDDGCTQRQLQIQALLCRLGHWQQPPVSRVQRLGNNSNFSCP